MQVEEIRRLSKGLFGNRYRLEVAAAIARGRGEPFTTQGIADDTGIRYPRVQEQLKHFSSTGVIRQLPPGEGREVEYKAEALGYWRACQRLLKELASA